MTILKHFDRSATRESEVFSQTNYVSALPLSFVLVNEHEARFDFGEVRSKPFWLV